MLELSNIYLFILASILLCLTPGPDNIYVLTQGMTKSKKAAVIATLGLCTGIIIHTSAATFGISIILKTSSLAFNIVKFVGATYLLYIGYKIFKHRRDPLDLSIENSKWNLKKLYFKAFFMNILNPKVAIFFLAFLPQFVNVDSGNVPIQMLLLGFIFMVLTIIIFSFIGISGNVLSAKLVKNQRALRYMNTLTSFVLGGLAIKLALSDS